MNTGEKAEGSRIEAKLDIKACFEQVSLPTTTLRSKSTAAVGKETTTTAVYVSTSTTERCVMVDGMYSPVFIPAQWIHVSSGDKEKLRTSQAVEWQSQNSDDKPSITIFFLSKPVYVESLTLINTRNVKSYDVYLTTAVGKMDLKQQDIAVSLKIYTAWCYEC